MSSSSNPLPYPLTENERGYSFTTAYGVEYLIALVSDRDLLPDEPFASHLYSFNIIVVNEQPPVGDPRVEATVIDVLNRVFVPNPHTIISYVCSLEDDQERTRRILFSRWYRQHRAGYTRLEYNDPSSRIYAAVLFAVSHLHQAAIEVAFNREYQTK